MNVPAKKKSVVKEENPTPSVQQEYQPGHLDEVTAKREEGARSLQSLQDSVDQVATAIDEFSADIEGQVTEAESLIDGAALRVQKEADNARGTFHKSKVNFHTQRLLVLVPYVLLSGVVVALYAYYFPGANLTGGLEVAAVLSAVGLVLFRLSWVLSSDVETSISHSLDELDSDTEILSPSPAPASSRFLNRKVLSKGIAFVKGSAGVAASAARVVFPKVDALFEAVDRREQQKTFVRHAHLMLARYHFPSSATVEEFLNGYRSASASSEKWQKDFVETVEKAFKVPPPIISMFYSESVSEEADVRSYWSGIRNGTDSLELFSELRTWLLNKGCVKVSDSFGSEVNEKLLNLALQSSDRTFSLGQVQDDVGSLAVNLSRIRSAIRRMDREFKLELVDVDTFVGLSLSGVDEVEQDCLAVVAKHNPTYNPEALAFLYSVIVGGTFLSDRFTKVKSTSVLSDSLEILRKKGILRETLPTNYLVAIASSQTEFSISELQHMSITYDDLKTFASSLHTFLLENGVATREQAPNIQEIMIECPPSSRMSLHGQFQRLAESMVADPLRDLSKHDLAVSLLTFFLKESQHPEGRAFCQLVAQNGSQSRLLYQFVEFRTSKVLEVSPPPLRLALPDKLPMGSPDEDFEGFREELANGNLFLDKRNLVRHRIERVKEEIREQREQLEGLKESVTSVLRSRLDVESIDDLLETGAIAAYIITVPSTTKDPVVDFLRSPELRGIRVRDLPNGGPSDDREVVILDDDPETSGKGARIGLVPQRMAFEEFGQRFDDALKLAVSPYNKRTGAQLPEKLPLFLMRILPAGEAMYVTGQETDRRVLSSKDLGVRPEASIKKLVVGKLTKDEQVDLLGVTVRRMSNSVAMKEVLRMHLEAPMTTLLGLARTAVAPDLSRYPSLEDLDVKTSVTRAFTRGDSLISACIQLFEQDKRLTSEQSKAEFYQRVHTALPGEVQRDLACESRVIDALYQVAKGYGQTFSLGGA